MTPNLQLGTDQERLPMLFATTRWNMVVNAADLDSPGASQALEELCRSYWYPLYAYVRRRGYSPEDAQDLTQAFFARLLAKNYVRQADRTRGRFRTFMLTAFSHFISDEWDRTQRLKAGGGQNPISLDALAAEQRYQLEPRDPSDPRELFDRRWAMTLLENVIACVEQEFTANGQHSWFLELKPFLSGERSASTYEEIAARLGSTVPALKMSVLRLRRRCRERIREEIALTVTTPEEAEEEYRALIHALRE